jgi:hypothetical protein
MLKYIKVVVSFVFQMPVYLFVVAKSAIGGTFQSITNGGVKVEEYFGLGGNDEDSDSDLSSDSSVHEVDLNNLDFLDFGGLDFTGSVIRSKRSASYKDMKYDVPYPKSLCSVQIRSEEKCKQELVEEKVGLDASVVFDFGPWLEVNNPCGDEINSKIVGAGAGEGNDEYSDSEIETLD